MNPVDVGVDDRVEVYTPGTGTYWGYVVSIDSSEITLDDVSPAGKPAIVDASTIVRRVFHGRRPEGHVGRWEGAR
ncbi:hypothetical protein ACFFX1_55665 [Dactylosporangium sucinum]|uniref:Uncharacterized protein n=1 Tax=Dactylosporangium sucinum TaxID=1424081 RepID=A0A917U1U9_9ACTN|nr:hypothetical protein [Dactylosporangium sucinum]GGM52259.1 hypothetical protein GCM10007977_062310 [Dactylosporangium sucinum]